MEKEKKIDEWEIEKALLDNPMYDSLVGYIKFKALGGRIGRVRFTEEVSVVICQMKYGKARLYFDIYLHKNGAINTMVFDFRHIFDTYVAKKALEEHGDDYLKYVYNILDKTKFRLENVCIFNKYKGGITDDKEKYDTFGISLVGYENEDFNLFTPWAGVLNEIFTALDEVNGFVGEDKKNKITRKDVDEAAVKNPLRLWVVIILAYLAIVGGLVLIIANKTWPSFLKWLVGIILIIGGLFFGPCVHLAARSDKKDYYANSGNLMKNFHKAEEKMFITIK